MVLQLKRIPGGSSLILTLTAILAVVISLPVRGADNALPPEIRDNYSGDLYLVRMGSAEVANQAAEAARFEIASYFEVKVSGERLVKQWYKSGTARGKMIEDNLSELTNTIIISAERDIPGIDIPLTRRNEEQKLYEAWAVLDKASYGRVLADRITAIDENAQRMYSRTDISDYDRIGNLKRIVGDLVLREKYKDDLTLLGMTGLIPVCPVDPPSVMEALDRLIADEFTVGIVCAEDVVQEVRSAIVKGAVDAGIRVKEYADLDTAKAENADVALNVSHSVSINTTSYNNFQFHNASWVLSLSLIEPETVKVIKSFVLEGKKAGAQNDNQARERMISEIITTQIQPITEFVYAAIFQPDDVGTQ